MNDILSDWRACAENKQNAFVYFIQNKPADLIKIGRSFDPSLRLKQIARDILSLEATIKVNGEKNSISLEKHLHQYFKETRVTGEWFIPSDDLNSLIADIKAGSHV